MIWCGKKSVARVAQRVAALVPVQGLSSLFSNVHCLFDPSCAFVWFSVQNSGGRPIDHVVLMRCNCFNFTFHEWRSQVPRPRLEGSKTKTCTNGSWDISRPRLKCRDSRTPKSVARDTDDPIQSHQSHVQKSTTSSLSYYVYLHTNSHLPDKPRLASFSSLFFLLLSRKSLWD